MKQASWLPSEDEIRLAIDRQRRERIRMHTRADDGDQTILMPPGPYKAPEVVDPYDDRDHWLKPALMTILISLVWIGGYLLLTA